MKKMTKTMEPLLQKSKDPKNAKKLKRCFMQFEEILNSLKTLQYEVKGIYSQMDDNVNILAEFMDESIGQSVDSNKLTIFCQSMTRYIKGKTDLNSFLEEMKTWKNASY